MYQLCVLHTRSCQVTPVVTFSRLCPPPLHGAIEPHRRLDNQRAAAPCQTRGPPRLGDCPVCTKYVACLWSKGKWPHDPCLRNNITANHGTFPSLSVCPTSITSRDSRPNTQPRLNGQNWGPSSPSSPSSPNGPSNAVKHGSLSWSLAGPWDVL